MRHILALVILLSTASCWERGGHTWTSLIMGSASAIRPASADYSLVAYVLKQTHEPLFRYDEDHQITSRVLKSWEHTEDYRGFTLCPRAGVQFEPGQDFAAADVQRLFADEKAETRIEGGCLHVSYGFPQPRFFERFTGLAKAPSRPTEDPRIEIGLGPFQVEKLSDPQIELKRKSGTRGRFDRIVLKNIQFMTPAQIEAKGIEDYNLIPEEKIPAWVTREYHSYPVSKLTVYVLVLNIPDAEARARIYNCLDVQALRAAYFEFNAPPHNVASLLPLGVRGSKQGLVAQNCDFEKKLSRRYTLLNWKPEKRAGLEKLFAGLATKTGIQIQAVDSSLTATAHKVMELHSGYDMVIMAINNERARPEEYLQLFLDPKKRIVSVPLEDLQRTMSQGGEVKAAELNRELLKRAVVLPLFQPVRTFYYPKYVKSVQFGASFYEYPEIAAAE